MDAADNLNRAGTPFYAGGGPTRTACWRQRTGTSRSIPPIMQRTACNALHTVTQRACRWLLQTRDRVDDDTFALKQEFLAMMLGVQRQTVTVVLRALQRDGLISSRYGRIQIRQRERLEGTACECYGVIREHFARLGLWPARRG